MIDELVQFSPPKSYGSPYGVTPILVKCLACGALLETGDEELHREGAHS